MLYVEKSDVHPEKFLGLLESTRQKTLERLMGRQRPADGIDFQNHVYDAMCSSAKSTEFDDTVRQTGAHGFPDIVAKNYYGVEVKMALGDKWSSLGNSILESTRAVDVKKIYMMFGRFGHQTDIRYRPYQEVLSDISVTHSPRYLIDMELPSGESIFDKMGVDYDEVRKQRDFINKVKQYYRGKLKPGQGLWWADATETGQSSIIRPLRTLPEEERKAVIAECMALFPIVFSNDQMKYEMIATYLVTNKGIISSNLRDHFSAGGKVAMKISGTTYHLPKIYQVLKESASDIRHTLLSIDKSKIEYYWDNKTHRPENDWLSLASELACGLPNKSLFREIYIFGQSENNRLP